MNDNSPLWDLFDPYDEFIPTVDEDFRADEDGGIAVFDPADLEGRLPVMALAA